MLDDYMPMGQDDVAAGLRAEQARMLDLVSGLDEAQLSTTSLCPDWRVRDVVAHLTGIAVDVLAGETANAGKPDVTARQVTERAELPMIDLLAEFDEARAGLVVLVDSLDAEAWESTLPSGQKLAHGAERLLEDIWVHTNDIVIPLGMDPVDGPGVAATMNVVLWEWRLRMAQFAPETPVTVSTGHVDLALGPEGGDRAIVGGDPALLALVASTRLTAEQAAGFGRCVIDPGVPAEVIDIYGEPVPDSTMFSTPA